LVYEVFSPGLSTFLEDKPPALLPDLLMFGLPSLILLALAWQLVWHRQLAG
jgi:hypothetical protein